MSRSALPKLTNKVVSRFLCIALATSVAVSFDVTPAEAQRRTLLEQWFPKAKRWKKKNRQPEVVIQQRNLEAAPIKRVKGPVYYTYKTEKLATVSLVSLAPAVSTTIVKNNALLGEDDLGNTISKSIDPARTGSLASRPHHLTKASLEGWSLKVEAGIAAAIADHYKASSDYVWVGKDWLPNEKAKAILKLFENASEFGLDPADYPVEFKPSQSAGMSEKQAAQFELALTAAVLRYGADAKNGRINPNRLSGYHDFSSYKRDYDGVRAAVLKADDPAFTLAGLHPNNTRFANLMAELAELLGRIDEDSIEPIAAKTFFKPGQENAELPKVIALIKKKASDGLRVDHAITFVNYNGSHDFNDDLVAIVKDFQKEVGLSADGIVGKNTIAKLQTVSPKVKIAKIELAMERMRWLPHSFGQRHVFINQPAYNASYMVNDKAQLSMRAIVGKPSNQTYFFYDTIELVEVNPYWNIPRSILVNEMIGKIRANPGYLAARNYEVVSYNGKPRDPYSVDWYSDKGTKGVYVRQKPGASNALGELKILFPNKHAIYMHDTPSRGLFKRSSRALSHGCIRLHKPRDMAAAVLQTSVGQVSSYVKSGKNQSIKVQNKIPVYVSYFTAWPKDDGSIGYYGDIYGRDKALTKAIERTKKLRASTSLVLS